MSEASPAARTEVTISSALIPAEEFVQFIIRKRVMPGLDLEGEFLRIGALLIRPKGRGLPFAYRQAESLGQEGLSPESVKQAIAAVNATWKSLGLETEGGTPQSSLIIATGSAGLKSPINERPRH